MYGRNKTKRKENLKRTKNPNKTHRILKVNIGVDGHKVFDNRSVTVFTPSVQARLSKLERNKKKIIKKSYIEIISETTYRKQNKNIMVVGIF